MPEACPRCLELEDELARITQIATTAGLYAAPSTGANQQYDPDAEARRWLAAHPRASAAEAWRGGWSRAWSIARELLRDWRRRWDGQAREISSLRSRMGVLLLEASRRDDNG
ncbi:MAG: hypothetical protein LC797_16160 [Chloroflexi bacterium]|nr:hypothetical protein [Chloroflexota bacterium]